MALWRYVLAADVRHDLADVDAAIAWIATAQGGPGPRLASCTWHREHRQLWREFVQTFRSVVSRLMAPGGELRASTMSDAAADRAFRTSVAELMPVLHPVAATLSQAAFRGLRLVPRYRRERLPPDAPRDVRAASQLRVFIRGWWSAVFGSMVEQQTVPRCEECGCELPNTPGGKLSTARFCKRCAFLDWERRQGADAIRGRNAENKRRSRARMK